MVEKVTDGEPLLRRNVWSTQKRATSVSARLARATQRTVGLRAHVLTCTRARHEAMEAAGVGKWVISHMEL